MPVAAAAWACNRKSIAYSRLNHQSSTTAESRLSLQTRSKDLINTGELVDFSCGKKVIRDTKNLVAESEARSPEDMQKVIS